MKIKATLSLILSAAGLCEVRHAVWVMKSRAAKCAVNRFKNTARIFTAAFPTAATADSHSECLKAQVWLSQAGR